MGKCVCHLCATNVNRYNLQPQLKCRVLPQLTLHSFASTPVKVEKLLDKQPELPGEANAMALPDGHQVEQQAVHLGLVNFQ